MEFIPKNQVIEFRENMMENIRKEFNVHQPGRMKEAVNILDAWTRKQRHFKKTDFHPAFLEASIIGSKGSIERAKKMLDKMCTLRTLLPHFFVTCNVKEKYAHVYKIVTPVILPKTSPDYYRIFMAKVNNKEFNSYNYMEYYRFSIILGLYLKTHDYSHGFIVVLDLRDTNVMEFVRKMSIIELRQIMTIYIEGHGMRLKGIHLITPNKFIEGLVVILKQILSPKLGARIHVHKTFDTIKDFLPIDIFPSDYGGQEKSLLELSEALIDVLSSDKHIEFIRDMNTAGTDENYRQADTFNDMYAGMPGTFRALSVD